jgi:micrococcal nuclease
VIGFVLPVLLLSFPFPAFADFSGRVVGVTDGDTVTVLHDRTPIKVRLFGIDCPEKRQAFGQKAKQFTSAMAFGQDVTIQEHGLDKYGRTLGDVMLTDGRSVNQELVKAGMAWQYRKYSQDRILAELEAKARKAKRGLWVDPHSVPPWEWRKMRKIEAGR